MGVWGRRPVKILTISHVTFGIFIKIFAPSMSENLNIILPKYTGIPTNLLILKNLESRLQKTS